MILLLHIKGSFYFPFFFSIFVNFSIFVKFIVLVLALHFHACWTDSQKIISFWFMQTCAIICRLYCTVCAETGTWGVCSTLIWDVTSVLCRFCSHLLCCRSSAIELRQFLIEHSLDQLDYHCICSCYSFLNRPSHWLFHSSRCSSYGKINFTGFIKLK